MYYLGDFSLSSAALARVHGLNGYKILVPGNHDRVWPPGSPRALRQEQRYHSVGFKEIYHKPRELMLTSGVNVLLWHLPYMPAVPPEDYDLRYAEYRPKDKGQWLLHGHVHEKWRKLGRQINVGVDAWGMKPVSEEQVIQTISDNREDIYVDFKEKT